MNIIYFCDEEGDIESDANDIKLQLDELGFSDRDIIGMEIVHEGVIANLNFDILFFDYGGAGTHLLHSFAREVVAHAKEHPNKVYIIDSKFSAAAIADWWEESIVNIFGNFDLAIPYLKTFLSKGVRN